MLPARAGRRLPGWPVGCILALGLLLPAAFAAAGELGAFFVPGPLAAFEQGPRQGSRLALRPRTAYAVIGLAWEGGERLWLKLNMPEHQVAVRGEGWTPLTAEELAARGAGLVEVYSHPVGRGQVPVRMQVPAAEVHLQPHGRGPETQAAGPPGAPGGAGISGGAPGGAGISGGAPGGAMGNETKQAYAQIVWRPVRYALRRAAQPWVAAAQGVYRPGRSPAFLTAAYLEMTTKRIPAESLGRLLAGVVHPGDSAQEVRWAWGEPLRTWSEGTEGQRTAVWEYAEGQLRFEGATVREVR